MSTATATPAATIDLYVRHQGGETERRTVMAEASTTPGLYVTPSFDGHGRLTGQFVITHGPSGMSVPIGEYGGVDSWTARRIAEALGETSVDWTGGTDELKATFEGSADVRKEIVAAVKRGMYPAPADEEDGKPVTGPADWPNTEQQATARQVAGHYTRQALDRYAWTWLLIDHDREDQPAARAYIENFNVLVAQYSVVYLLRVLELLDPDAANAAARELWEAVVAGDSFGEWLAEWGREYGIPVPPEQTEVPGVGLPAAISFERVLKTPLMYPDHGTIGSMREQLARLAYKGQERFGELTDEMMSSPEDGPFAKASELHIAHGCSYFGWALLSVLSLLAREHPHLALRVARMVDDIGTNGGCPHADDIDFPPSSGPGPMGEITLTDKTVDEPSP